MSAASFPIEGLRGGPLSLQALQEMDPRCRRMPENEKCCRDLLEHLEYLHDYVAPLGDEDPLKPKYIRVIVDSVNLMRRKPLLWRLANSNVLATTIRELHLKLSDIGQALGLSGDQQMTKWEIEWDTAKAEQTSKLQKLVSSSSERILVNECKGDKKLKAILMALKSSMQWKDQPPMLLELKRETYERVVTFSGEGLHVYDWFIAIDNLEFEDEMIGNRGSFGDVTRGSWIHDDQRTDVVVKRLFDELTGENDDSFLRQLELWGNLPSNDYILKLFGGSHVTTPQYYVCESAHFGNLVDFLLDEARQAMFWRLFKHVALGLQFLHEQQIVHGGLKGSNILIGENYTAKLADFGFSTVRSLSAGMSDGAKKMVVQAVRWRPLEVLIESGKDVPLFESDIYSLGMCMIEARSGEVPFGLEDDEVVLKWVMAGERHLQPEGTSDAEWAFISQLCDPDFKKRPTLDQVLEGITTFAEQEELQHPMASIA